MDKKEGEPSLFYRGAAHLIFIAFILYVIGVFFIHPDLFGEPSITGHAVYDENSAVSMIEDAVSGASFMATVTDLNACILIDDNGTEHSFNVVADTSTVTATPSSGLCDGAGQEDIILKFVDYDSFVETMEDLSVATLMSGKGGNRYYIMESNLVEQGGDVKCDSIFKVKYCSALDAFGTPEELIAGDLSCCIEQPTKEQLQLIEEHAASKGFDDEYAAMREAAPTMELPEFLTGYMFYAVLGGLLLIGIGVLSLRKKPGPKKASAQKTPGAPSQASAVPAEDPKITQLRGYVYSMLKAGYPKGQVYSYLQQQGWQTDTLNRIFSTTQQQAPAQQQSSASQNSQSTQSQASSRPARAT